MFYGERQHAVDEKGRVVLPSEYRSHLANGAYLAKGPDQCLVIYASEEWDRIVTNVRELSKQGMSGRQAARSFFASTAHLVPDKQGRVAIPNKLREFARLEGDVVVVGCHDRIEIWNVELWDQQQASGDVSLTSPDEIPAFGI